MPRPLSTASGCRAPALSCFVLGPEGTVVPPAPQLVMETLVMGTWVPGWGCGLLRAEKVLWLEAAVDRACDGA